VVIELDDSVGKLRLAKSGASSDHVDGLTINLQNCVDVIKIAVTPTPEIELAQARVKTERRRRSGFDSLGGP
jgi:hypothetical protein